MRTSAVCSVVIGTDLGELACRAIRWVGRDLAPGATRIVVHVVTPTPASNGRRQATGAEVAAGTAREEVERRLPEMLACMGDSASRGEIREGEVTRELIRVANESEADLIVLGRKGRDRLVGMRVGTTAERLVHDSPIPVLVAGGMIDRAPRSLLLAMDGSDSATRALRWARVFAVRPGTRVVALHAVDLYETDLLHRMARSESVRQEEELRMENGRTWLRRQSLSAGFSPDELCVRVVIGDPRVEVVAAARRRADLIVLGQYGTGSHRRRTIGSVTRAVLRGTACSVLTVP